MKHTLSKALKALAVIGAVASLAAPVLADTTQCVTNNGDYQIDVDWYKSTDVFIDNTEPWNNRLLLRRSTKSGSGKCGTNAVTGALDCQGVHVSPKESKRLRSLAKQSNKQSCVTSPKGDMFAIVSCVGCERGTQIVTAAAGTVAGMALPGGNLGAIIYAAADSQGVGLNSAVGSFVGHGSGKVQIRGKVKSNLPIHDTSDLEDTYKMGNVIFMGTPNNVQSKGAFFSAHAYEKKNELPRYAYRYTFEIDCYLSTGLFSSVEYADTRDTIIVKFMRKGEVLSTKMIKGDDINCKAVGADTRWTSKSLGEKVDTIRVETTGENAFLMDQVKLSYYQVGLESNGSFEVNIGGGIDNDKGWCLSTDKDDSFGEHGKVCRRYRDFKVK